MKALYRSSVWAPDAIPIEEWKYRNLTRIMFPIIYALMVFGGIAAIIWGIPAISEFFPKLTTTLFAISLLIAALNSLVGVSFPKHWAFEICGNVLIFGLMVAYLFALIILAASSTGNRGFLLFMVAITIPPVVWRLSVLGVEWQARRLNLQTKTKLGGY